MGFAMPSNTKPTQNIDKPCWAHVAVISLVENPPKTDGGVYDALAVRFVVLAATDESQVKRTGLYYFNNPNMSHKDGGEFASACQVRLAQACEINPIVNGQPSTWDKAMPGSQVDIGWMKEDGSSPAAGKQLMVKFDHGWDSAAKKKTDKIQVDGLHVYHLEDEDVAGYPKSESALKLIGKQHLAVKTAPKSATKTTQAKAAPKQEAVLPNGEVDVNDL